jgi:hypothetical protein
MYLLTRDRIPAQAPLNICHETTEYSFKTTTTTESQHQPQPTPKGNIAQGIHSMIIKKIKRA